MGLLRYTDAESGVVQYIFEDELGTTAENINNEPQADVGTQVKNSKKRRLVRSKNNKQDSVTGAVNENKEKGKNQPRERDYKKMLGAGLLLCLFAIGIGFSYSYSRVDVAGYRIGELKSQIAALEEEQENLQRQVSDLTSLERVEKAAVKNLGMVAPTTTDVLLVNEITDSQDTQKSGERTGKNDKEEQGEAAVADGEVVSGSERSSIIQILAGLID